MTLTDPKSARPWQVHRAESLTRLDSRGLWDACFRCLLPWEEAAHREALAAVFQGKPGDLDDAVIEAVVGVVARGEGGEPMFQAVDAAAVPELQQPRGGRPRAPWALLLPKPIREKAARMLAFATFQKAIAARLCAASPPPPAPPTGEAIATAAGWVGVCALDSIELEGGLPRALSTAAWDYLRRATKDAPGEEAPARWDILAADAARAVRWRWEAEGEEPPAWRPVAVAVDWHAEAGDVWVGELDLAGLAEVLRVAYRDVLAAADFLGPWISTPSILAFVGADLPFEHRPDYAGLTPPARAMAATAYRFAAGHAAAAARSPV